MITYRCVGLQSYRRDILSVVKGFFLIMANQDVIRLDKWLWAARFYKTRLLAAEAVNGGHVHINGIRAKPAKLIRPGDELRISKGHDVFTLDVLALAAKRGPAAQAQQLYHEHEQSVRQRQQQAEQRKLQAAQQVAPRKRPDKRSRRKIIRFINKHQHKD